MRNVLLLIVGLLLFFLLIFLIWFIFFRSGDPPIAVDDNFSTMFETAVSNNVLLNDSDPEGETLTVTTSQLSGPSNGGLTLGASGDFTYTPNPGYSGTDQFRYQVCDPDDACDEADVVIAIELPDVPEVIATDDAAKTMVNTAVSINVLANDVGDNLSVNSINSQPANGTVELQADGTILYTPNADNTTTDSFAYEACSPTAVCDSAQVTITVMDFQVNDDAYSTPKNEPLTDNVRDNDVGNPTITNTPVVTPTSGSMVIQADGAFVYTPNDNYIGDDSFTYEGCNATPLCDTAVVSIKVGGPILSPDSLTTDIDKPVDGNVVTNDVGEGLQVTKLPATAPENGAISDKSGGNFTYTPNTDFTGTDTFTYEACDNDGVCATETVTIEVKPIPTSATHTVVQGEWLLQIARCYGTTTHDIRTHNYIPYPDLIYPGQQLYIPNVGSVGTISGPPCLDYHIVEADETLGGIAKMYGIIEHELARVNGLYVYHYYYKDIYVGQKLIVPRPVPDYMQPNP